MAFSEDFLYQLRMATPIEQLFRSYVNVQKAGRLYSCCCPFHSDKSPSCYIYPDTQSFYCFGCGVGGDAVTFIKLIENVNYAEAVSILAERGGITIPQNRYSEDDTRRRQRILEINRETARFYYKNLLSDKQEGLRYLAGRGVKPETIKKFGLGYAIDSWDHLSNHLLSMGFRNKELVEAGVAKERNSGGIYDFFRNRVMFPIWDLRGNIIAFGGRALNAEEKSKYLNTGENSVFHKNRNLYALHIASKSNVKRLILAEGYMDVVSLHQGGFDSAVATLGTSLTTEQAGIIAQKASEVIIAYDSDFAGQKATQRAINLLADVGITPKVLHIEGAKDPDEYIKKYGATSLKLLMDDSQDAVLFELERCKLNLDINTEQGRVEAIQKSIAILAGLNNVVQRDVYASRIAKEFSVDPNMIRTQIQSLAKRSANVEKKREWQQIQQRTLMRDRVNPDANEHRKESGAEEMILLFMLRNPERISEVASAIQADLFVTEFHKRMYMEIVHLGDVDCATILSGLSEFFAPEEMGRISSLLAKNREIAICEEDVNRNIQILTDYWEKKNLYADLSDTEALLKLAEKKRQEKK